ncbi:hypothetical protein HELRODRAFT_180603 [Helobdella robusta]|uniref:Immunoglobulin V-set domain-containing protein n=1 Tax=Helobdella robusta TaxID=6412 RepID=T1FG30_HELRO|nr:hypothetical protein HELRODRAFT_180603 [Helobdella robusta]ESN93737.1 hypothetical protein HELRODRAFT_180603 [Helobdella robusta]
MTSQKLVWLFTLLLCCCFFAVVSMKTPTSPPTTSKPYLPEVTMVTKPKILLAEVGSNVSMDCEFKMATYSLFDNPQLWTKQQLPGDELELNLMGIRSEKIQNLTRSVLVFIGIRNYRYSLESVYPY